MTAERAQRLWGWGRAVSAVSEIRRPLRRAEVDEVLALARAEGRTIGLRGAGQSYGDAALNGGGICLDLTGMSRILDWDPGRGVIRVEPGVTIRQLWRHVLPAGWWPAVVPGTAFASIGGCAGANVHGKNNWKVGPFGEHVEAFELLLPTGEVKTCSRGDEAELFHAALGGFGLLGCFLSVTLRLRRVESGLLAVRAASVRNLEEMISLFDDRRERVEHMVGWVDAFAAGAGLGRGIVHEAVHIGADAEARRESLAVAPQGSLRDRLGVPPAAWHLLRPLVRNQMVRAANAAVFHLARRRVGGEIRQPLARFNFLLDAVSDWKLAYGDGGLIEYQSFVPRARAAAVFGAQLAAAQRAGTPPYAAAFKCHRADPFLLSHGVDGYSLGLHFKVEPARRNELWGLTAAFDRLVADAGGRLYFAKDCTTTPEIVRRVWGDEVLDRFRRLKARCDPQEILQTDLYRRLLAPQE